MEKQTKEEMVKDFERQLDFIPKEIWLDDEMYEIETTSDEKKMGLGKPEPKKVYGKYDSFEKKITLFGHPDMSGNCLHEIIHLLFDHSGYVFKSMAEEEMLTRILTRGIKSYLIACQKFNQQIKLNKKSIRKK